MTATTMIKECAATTCAFNNSGCTALAVTIGGNEKASCETFVTLDIRRSVNTDAGVGACHRLECVHNEELLCGLGAVNIGSSAECASYEAK
ncbi:Leu/Phe-tRNA-protein transferase [Trueperella bonasi]|uniref:Leu/Phe-tRNA-protein transferase n=1 Tax=Trueperella bonasi TaxID=312286 RepID=A0ABT9NF90_9ACTO|nr:DUF1540 domain-containing protein [Trueperella bonasi]MDP9805708.1 Leu/Phe-tRNA-protein transferase [Trueperella bonasi]